MEGSMNLITLVGILSRPDDEEFFNIITILVISFSVAGSRNIDFIQGGPR
jgi:hypothetical protein